MISLMIQLDKTREIQPCRCLCLGSVEQITITAPFRRMTLQLRQIFFTDALTFISFLYLDSCGQVPHAIDDGQRNIPACVPPFKLFLRIRPSY